MALPTVIKTLKNFLGTKIVAPKTVTQAITHFGSKFNDRRLDQVIDEMKVDLDAKASSTDLTELRNKVYFDGYNWRDYSDIGSALTAKIRTFDAFKPHTFMAILQGGAPFYVSLVVDADGYGAGFSASYLGNKYLIKINAYVVTITGF